MISDHNSGNRAPITHQKTINTSLNQLVSLIKLGFRGRLSHWFYSSFKRLTQRRDLYTGEVTVTKVGGLSLAQNYLDDIKHDLEKALSHAVAYGLHPNYELDEVVPARHTTAPGLFI